jgi:hypothetical protein
MLRNARRLIPLTILALAPLLFAADAEKANVPDEKILPVDKAPSDAPLRPTKGLTLYKLTSLRVTESQLTVHYIAVSGTAGKDGPGLVVRFPDGKELFTVSARELASRTKSGKMIDLPKGKGKGKGGAASGPANAGEITVDAKGLPGGLPKNLEVYAVHVDRGLEKAGLMSRFKVSNSVVVGKMELPRQLAREWKPDELATLNNAPPVVNANKGVGKDTAFVGNTEGLLPALRYADARKRSIVGVIYAAGEAEITKGEKVGSLTTLTPAYGEVEPLGHQKVELAKPGYAVGALNVKTRKIVTGVQLVFMKQKADGTLDPSDAYNSEWLGKPGEGDKEATLSGKGRKVIGIHLKHFGVVHAVALVLQ